MTEDIRVGVDTSRVDLTLNHQVLDSQGEHDALSKQTCCKTQHRSQLFLPFPLTNTLSTDVPDTVGHLLRENIFAIVDEVNTVGSPPTARGVSPIKWFLIKIFISSSLRSLIPHQSYSQFGRFLFLHCEVNNEIFVKSPVLYIVLASAEKMRGL